MVPPDGGVFSRHRRQIRSGVPDGLHAGLFIVGQHGHQIRRRRAFLAPDLHLLVDMQNLHHLGVEIGVAPLQIILDLVRTHLVGARWASRVSFLIALLETQAGLPTITGILHIRSLQTLLTMFKANFWGGSLNLRFDTLRV